ncbi:hypothetical protein GCM10011380_32810 [Sphingomonas metalli]|jgi:hypothetical protein|uniref:Ice-binding protein C-terminal domain-containing protein n=1 Tax=Sphingomonas metalli TaxID=1779358 RepID=A0A916TEX9_9SPHN|nr:PEPxxWA-CTERM sorting domain-containing protein [Sphingomonas metalli]GGB40782.1 hypothetical protein GCM10011380_32810 [Sphingomonas metalli]
MRHMRQLRLALYATAAVFVSSHASAAVTPTLGGASGNYLTLSATGLSGANGQVATLTGGRIYNSDQPFADIPKGGVFGGNFLAAGPTAGQPATLTFLQAVTNLGFLWGSPDTYNSLTLVTNQRSITYTAQSLGFTTTDGNQNVSQYVNFAATAGETITSVSFSNSQAIDAFEVANFAVTAVPEPTTWALMFVGFGMVAGAARYRRRNVAATYA